MLVHAFMGYVYTYIEASLGKALHIFYLSPKVSCVLMLKQTILRNHLLIIFFELFVQVNYGNFMHGLMKENIQLNRKVLSELSMHEPFSFKALVDVSRNAFPGNRPVPAKEGLASIL
jgi:hypothetical protein